MDDQKAANDVTPSPAPAPEPAPSPEPAPAAAPDPAPTPAPEPSPAPSPAPAEDKPHSFLSKALKVLGKIEHFTEEEVEKLYELIKHDL